MRAPQFGHYVEFYAYHLVFLVSACAFLLFEFRPDLLDWIRWLAALLVVLWTTANSSLFPKLLGHEIVESYRTACVKSIGKMRRVALVLGILLAIAGTTMFSELRARFQYVGMIKELTLESGSESLPFPAPADLAKAYNLYPHRKEVLFIVNRMGRLLAFDDETSNFNVFINTFLNGLDVKKIENVYHDRSKLDRYEGAIDPILVVARLYVESIDPSDPGAPAKALTKALALLDQHRKGDAHAEFYRLLYEHDLASAGCQIAVGTERASLQQLQARVAKLLTSIRDEKSPKTHIRLATSHAFQELLDHDAQLRIETTDLSDKKSVDAAVINVPRLYNRVLTVRQNVANATDVPWLESAGKFTLYHYFKHAVGRPTSISVCVRKLVDRIPGLTEAMDKTVISAEAFKEFRDLSVWDRGTPQSAAYAGTGMHKKFLEWLKTGWRSF